MTTKKRYSFAALAIAVLCLTHLAAYRSRDIAPQDTKEWAAEQPQPAEETPPRPRKRSAKKATAPTQKPASRPGQKSKSPASSDDFPREEDLAGADISEDEPAARILPPINRVRFRVRESDVDLAEPAAADDSAPEPRRPMLNFLRRLFSRTYEP